MSTWQDWGSAAGCLALGWNVAAWVVEQYRDHRADRRGRRGWL